MTGADGSVGAGEPPEGPVGTQSADNAGSPYGETWVYESIVGVLPGYDIRPWVALVLQFVGFEAAVFALGLAYDLPTSGLVAGSIAVGVATVGSAAMITIGRTVRGSAAPADYRRLLLGTNVEIVLGLGAFLTLVTYLFVIDPRAGPVLLTDLLGGRPPALAVFLLLLVLWDLCYRIGAAWWSSVAALWRSLRCPMEPATAARLRRLDLLTMGFGVLQLALVPLVAAHPVLAGALLGHVVAVLLVSGASVALLRSHRIRTI